MLNNVTSEISNEMAKKKDLWLLETLEKHNLIKSDDITNFELYWLREEMGVKVITQDSKTQIYVKDNLIGEWLNDYQIVKSDDDKYSVKTSYWN